MLKLEVRSDVDVRRARREAAAIALGLGMDRYAVEAVAISVSEIATNQVRHAGGGTISLSRVEREGRAGVEVEALDQGPGIADVERAMQDGYSTTGSMGSGLPAARRLMDDFEIASAPGEGTRVLMRKWAP